MKKLVKTKVEKLEKTEEFAKVKEFKKEILHHLTCSLARDTNTATNRDWWLAICYAVRDKILARFLDTQMYQHNKNIRRVYYFSLEYLMGRLLTNNLINLEFNDVAKAAIEELCLDYDSICGEEFDMGLGNGGLGRLAACFLDSLASLDMPAIGYGIQYEFGLFKQKFVNCKQEEHPDNWLRFGNPWRIVRPEQKNLVHLYGRVEEKFDDKGDCSKKWVDTKTLEGVPWDMPIVGYGANTVNFLRLWESRASEEFDFKIFNEGGYVDAVREKAMGETISKVLYPNDQTECGKELRLVQQYFFVSCSLQDIIRRYKSQNKGWSKLAEKIVIQLNDTHPAISVIELMRILIDEEGMKFEQAWQLCSKIFAYTNHTLLPEALEKWSVPLLQKVLPRHLQIAYEINHHFLNEVVERAWPGDDFKKQALSIIEEGEVQYVRMAYLAVAASFSINGVAALHTDLLKKQLFKDFYELFPKRFNNKTNGVSPRRWLQVCNKDLSNLITSKIGDGWVKNLELLKNLEKFADDEKFLHQFAEVKNKNKINLSNFVSKELGVDIDPKAIFDVQVKRMHEYKRQHMNLMHILKLYKDCLHSADNNRLPRVFLFAAKAAPGYHFAKQIIQAINIVAEKINKDQRIKDKLKIVFVPNYGVSLAEKIIPAADISEQISTAGKEASGTGNMKLGLNGACTIGTLDGANVEMLEQVGEENIFIFGNTVESLRDLKHTYNPWDIYNNNENIRLLLDWMSSGVFCKNGEDPLKAIKESLLEFGDPYFVLADFDAYCSAQEEIEKAYSQKLIWNKKCLLNVARLGYFSSDRTINQYAKEIWSI